MQSLKQRLRGGIEGLLIGDALGVPYEFQPPEDLPARKQLEMEPPHWFERSHDSVPPGTWSDDGAQALCLLASLSVTKQLDVNDFAKRLVAWYDEGYLAVDNVVFDVGVGTSGAILTIMQGVSPLKATRTDVKCNGNGALMRILPLALWHLGSDAELVEDAHLQTRVTHGHPRAWACSALYVLWARGILRQFDNPWDRAVATVRDLYKDDDCLTEQLEFNIRPDEPIEGQGSGYVVDCLRSSRMILSRENSYEDSVKGAVALGDDTDTTAAVTGGIAGLRWGINGIPQRWQKQLRGRNILEPLLEPLFARHAV